MGDVPFSLQTLSVCRGWLGKEGRWWFFFWGGAHPGVKWPSVCLVLGVGGGGGGVGGGGVHGTV